MSILTRAFQIINSYDQHGKVGNFPPILNDSDVHIDPYVGI